MHLHLGFGTNIVFESQQFPLLPITDIVFGRQANWILSCFTYYRANSHFSLHFPPCFRMLHDSDYWNRKGSPSLNGDYYQGRPVSIRYITVTPAGPIFSLFFYLISSAGPISCSNNEIWRGENSASEVQTLFIEIARAQCAEEDTIEHKLRCS